MHLKFQYLVPDNAEPTTRQRIYKATANYFIEIANIIINASEFEFDKAGTKMEDSYIVTKTGKMVAFKLDRNCGCGSRLRAWNPYRHVYSSKDPSK